MAFLSVRTTWSWPTTSSNVCGRHFRAMTWYLLRTREVSGKISGQALHGTGRTSVPLLPSGPGGVRAPAHAWHLAEAQHAPPGRARNTYFGGPCTGGLALAGPWPTPRLELLEAGPLLGDKVVELCVLVGVRIS